MVPAVEHLEKLGRASPGCEAGRASGWAAPGTGRPSLLAAGGADRRSSGCRRCWAGSGLRVAADGFGPGIHGFWICCFLLLLLLLLLLLAVAAPGGGGSGGFLSNSSRLIPEPRPVGGLTGQLFSGVDSGQRIVHRSRHHRLARHSCSRGSPSDRLLRQRGVIAGGERRLRRQLFDELAERRRVGRGVLGGETGCRKPESGKRDEQDSAVTAAAGLRGPVRPAGADCPVAGIRFPVSAASGRLRARGRTGNSRQRLSSRQSSAGASAHWKRSICRTWLRSLNSPAAARCSRSASAAPRGPPTCWRRCKRRWWRRRVPAGWSC